MMGVRREFKICKSLFIGTVLAVGSAGAFAQQLGVTGNAVTVSNAGGGFGPTSVPIASNGTVSAITGLPTSTTLDVPTFTFNMSSNGVNDAVHTFRVGFVIDDDTTQRRLEIDITGITMTFTNSGTTLTGSVTGATTTVYGRNADGSITLMATPATPGTVAFSGTTLSFDADDALASIVSGGGILADVINSMNATGIGYTYAVVLKQTSGGQALQFGHSPGGSFTAFPTSTTDFILQANALQANLFGGYKLSGTLSFGSSGGSGGGSGSSSESQISAAVGTASNNTLNLINSIAAGGATAATNTQLSSLVNTTAQAVSDVITNGSQATLDSGITLLATLAKQMQVVRQVTDAGIEVDTLVTRKIVTFAYQLVLSFKNYTLDGPQRLNLKTALNSTFTDTDSFLASLRGKFGFISTDALESHDAITLDTSIADISGIVEDLELTINAALEIPDFDIESETFVSMQNVSQSAAELLLAPVGTQLGLTIAYSSDSATAALLSSNTTLMDRLLDVAGINVGISTKVDATALETSLTAAGLSAASASSLSTSASAFVKADGLNIDSGSGVASVSTSLETALGATGLSVNGTTGLISLTLANEAYTVLLQGVFPAPALLPTGTHKLPDGSSLVVKNGLAYLLVPASADIVEFASAINSIGAGAFSTNLGANGNLTLLENASNIGFTASFSSGSISSSAAISSTAFGAASGDPASSNYNFTVKYKDGREQVILPVIADSLFFQSVANYGFKVTTDKTTGVIQIDGFNFRPDYFINPLTAADTTFLTANADTSGVAYRPVDANGDGKTDYQIITSAGVQTVYGLQ